jgi:hypothetical protein
MHFQEWFGGIIWPTGIHVIMSAGFFLFLSPLWNLWQIQ